MGGQSRDRAGGGRDRGVSGERAILRLAAQQHGVISRRQLLDLGVGRDAIDTRLKSGRLRGIRRGIYAIGPTLLPLARESAAILACGDEAVLSHRSAAALHQVLTYPAQSAPVTVTVGPADPGSKPGIHIHRATELPPDEITARHRIPLTTPARTLLDLAAELSTSKLEHALAQSHRKRLTTPKALHTLIARYPGRPGTPALKALLDADRPPAFTRSNAERRLLALIRRAGLPEPQTNVVVAGFELDFYWPGRRLVVELDGYPFHSARPDRRRDHERDAELTLRGHTVLRLEPGQVEDRPEATVALLARATR